jgi:hypothetical protein
MRRLSSTLDNDVGDDSAVFATALECIMVNKSTKKTANKSTRKSAKVARKVDVKRDNAKPVLLAGGNPQIAKADGDAPVQAYIAAMPDWKREVGQRFDALIERTAPDVRKAVRWNSPFYGIEGQGWFLSYHCFAKYIKVTFLRGTALHPLPPVESKDPHTRYLHIHENEPIDEERVASWIKQAAELPGAPLF